MPYTASFLAFENICEISDSLDRILLNEVPTYILSVDSQIYKTILMLRTPDVRTSSGVTRQRNLITASISDLFAESILPVPQQCLCVNANKVFQFTLTVFAFRKHQRISEIGDLVRAVPFAFLHFAFLGYKYVDNNLQLTNKQALLAIAKRDYIPPTQF